MIAVVETVVPFTAIDGGLRGRSLVDAARDTLAPNAISVEDLGWTGGAVTPRVRLRFTFDHTYEAVEFKLRWCDELVFP